MIYDKLGARKRISLPEDEPPVKLDACKRNLLLQDEPPFEAQSQGSDDPCQIYKLPVEVLENIFKQLPYKTISNCRLVSRRFCHVIDAARDLPLQEIRVYDLEKDGHDNYNLVLDLLHPNGQKFKTMRLSNQRRSSRLQNVKSPPIFKWCCIQQLGYYMFNDEDDIRRFADELRMMSQLGGHRMTVNRFGITESTFFFENAERILKLIKSRCLSNLDDFSEYADISELCLAVVLSCELNEEFLSEFDLCIARLRHLTYSHDALKMIQHTGAQKTSIAVNAEIELFRQKSFKRFLRGYQVDLFRDCLYLYGSDVYEVLPAIANVFMRSTPLDLEFFFRKFTPYPEAVKCFKETKELLSTHGFKMIRCIGDTAIHMLDHPQLDWSLRSQLVKDSRSRSFRSWSLDLVQKPKLKESYE